MKLVREGKKYVSVTKPLVAVADDEIRIAADVYVNLQHIVQMKIQIPRLARSPLVVENYPPLRLGTYAHVLDYYILCHGFSSLVLMSGQWTVDREGGFPSEIFI